MKFKVIICSFLLIIGFYLTLNIIKIISFVNKYEDYSVKLYEWPLLSVNAIFFFLSLFLLYEILRSYEVIKWIICETKKEDSAFNHTRFMCMLKLTVSLFCITIIIFLISTGYGTLVVIGDFDGCFEDYTYVYVAVWLLIQFNTQIYSIFLVILMDFLASDQGEAADEEEPEEEGSVGRDDFVGEDF